MSGKNLDEDHAVDLRSARDAYGLKQATADDQSRRDNAHFMRLFNDSIREQHGTP